MKLKSFIFILSFFLPLPASVEAQNCGLIDVEIRGVSLAPLYQNGDHLDAVRRDCLERPIIRNDIIVFKSGASKLPLIKRIIATPGDRFALRENHLFINDAAAQNSQGRVFHFPENAKKLIRLYEIQFGGVLPQDIFLVMGESDGVLDSTRFGPVHRQDILYIGLPRD